MNLSRNEPRVVLEGRLLCDLELLVVGGFAPLTGFLLETEYDSVVDTLRLPSGEVWPMPIVYPISEEERNGDTYRVGNSVTLTDNTNLPIARLHVEEVYKPDLEKECDKAYGTTDLNHPYVGELLGRKGVTYYVGGRVECIQTPHHFDFREDRRTPAEVRAEIARHGWKAVVGFQTRNPMHRSHQELTLRAREEMKTLVGITDDAEAGILLHPVVGVTQACDVDYHTRVNCYKRLIPRYPHDCATLSLLPLSMRMAGPREALWHALIRRNYGCTHFVVGRDHAGPSYKRADGEPFYGPYDAHELVERFADEIGIHVIKSKLIVYLPDTCEYKPINEVTEGTKVENISGTQLRQMLTDGTPLPTWFTYPEISEELQRGYRTDRQKGLCFYAVGLSGSGKSYFIGALRDRLQALGDHRRITVLDGDVVRQELSKGLGFTREDRSTNVRRIGYVASQVVRHGGICLCANIAPYLDDRQYNRRLVEAEGGVYVEISVDTPLSICEARDCKGLYKLAREGKIKEFTGISDPFEVPENPEATISSLDTVGVDNVINELLTAYSTYFNE